ncbi:phospholipase A2 inhibitor gamma subunit B-like [Hyla sarda]|uniref:phospholipase A2 inhibitor gamma subunit B-like n=1 Tax=Hyla sarda TaxID=327740 RepID=UPI0024C39DAD|nr:phospholipase A2 inhibitor gamma subunit B-like [Hyla sarda]
MKYVLVVFILLPSMISTGYSLTCISCTSTTQTPCTGSAVTCAATEDVCTSIYTETKLTVYGITSYAIVRGCGASSECDNPKSLSNQFMTVDINTGCCQSNNCTPAAAIVTPNTVTNNLACPSCFTLTSSTCVPDSQIECTGSEIKCTTYSITTLTDPSRPILAMAGCASENMCSNYNGTASSSVTGQMNISIGCSNATVSPSAISSTITPSSNKESVPSTASLTATSHAETQTYYFTTDIANSYPSINTSDIYYTTNVTFTPTPFHSTLRQSVTSTCVCNGCENRHFKLATLAALIVTLVKYFL